jgi:hypothetical protein
MKATFPLETILASMRQHEQVCVKMPALNHFMSRLEGKLLEVLKGNPSANVPYHNNVHMEGVWSIAQVMWEAEGEDLGLGGDWAYVALMFVTLLHDYGHSAGKDNDHYNVLSTREFVAELIARNGYSLPSRVVEVIDSAIECTEFPFVIPPRNKLEMVMRDCDVLYATVSLDPVLVMENLRAEIQVAAKRDVTYEEMLVGQSKFMESAELFTVTGRAIWDIYAPRYLVRLQEYAKEKGTPDA